jgi:(p)ppGpp synthase/HD superfamily hydrolase
VATGTSPAHQTGRNQRRQRNLHNVLTEQQCLGVAIRLAVTAHDGQMNQDGTPYITHPLRLMAAASTPYEQMTAVLHDVIEDTELAISDLANAGIPHAVCVAVHLLTKRPEHQGDDGYVQFIARVKGNSLARKVKLLDLYDNIDVTRLSVLGDYELKRVAKYYAAIRELQNM